MSPRSNLVLIILVVGVLVGARSVFTVDQREHALKRQFGEIVGADYTPGLHFRVPFVQDVLRFPNRILTYEDNSGERFLTG